MEALVEAVAVSATAKMTWYEYFSYLVAEQQIKSFLKLLSNVGSRKKKKSQKNIVLCIAYLASCF